jgi:hypothetical protein
MHLPRTTHPNQAPVRTCPTARADREQAVRLPNWAIEGLSPYTGSSYSNHAGAQSAKNYRESEPNAHLEVVSFGGLTR